MPSTTIRGSVLFSLARFAASRSLALRSPSSTGTTATRAGLPRAKAAARCASRFAMQDTWFRTRAAPVSSATAAPAPVRFAGCSVRRSRRDVREVTTSRYRPRLLPTVPLSMPTYNIMAGLAAPGSGHLWSPPGLPPVCPCLHSRTCTRAFHPPHLRARTPTQALEPTRRPYLRCESLRPRRSSRASRRERQAPSA